MVTAHQQPDGSIAINNPVDHTKATGPLVWAAHYKEFKEHDKREKRGGNATTGSSLGAVTPTAYDIDSGVDTRAITERQQLKRTIAQELGVDSENWRVAEELRARDHGGPYEHTHERPLESWKAEFHLQRAHGISLLPDDPWSAEAAHNAAHIRMARAGEERPETDWHDSIDIDV